MLVLTTSVIVDPADGQCTLTFNCEGIGRSDGCADGSVGEAGLSAAGVCVLCCSNEDAGVAVLDDPGVMRESCRAPPSG